MTSEDSENQTTQQVEEKHEDIQRLIEKIDEIQESIKVLQESVNKLQGIAEFQNTLPKTIEYLIQATFNKYLILPEDYKQEPIKEEKRKKELHRSEKHQKEEEEEEEETPKEEKKIVRVGKVTEFKELPDKQNVFAIKDDNLVIYDGDVGVIEMKDESEETLFELPDEVINDIGFKKDGTLIVGTSEKVIGFKNGEREIIDTPAQSCCEFNGQIVSVCQKGLVYEEGGEQKIMKQVNSKIEFKEPSKVRASENYLFVNDTESKVLTIFDKQFRIRKAINSAKFLDFCIISDIEVGLLFDKGIRIVNLSEKSVFSFISTLLVIYFIELFFFVC